MKKRYNYLGIDKSNGKDQSSIFKFDKDPDYVPYRNRWTLVIWFILFIATLGLFIWYILKQIL